MTAKAIELGQNAFDAVQEKCVTVDTNRAGKIAKKQGKMDGQVNYPDSQASQLGASEQEIIMKTAQTVEQTRHALSQHFSGFRERLMPAVRTWDLVALIDTIQTIPDELQNKLNNIFGIFEIESNIKGSEWQNAQEEYGNFRQKNKLTRNPDYHALNSSVIWLVIFLVGEAILNATLLWELTGVLRALGQTLLITLVNVVILAAAFGLCFRYKNHVLQKTRWLTLICIPVVLAVLTFNLGIGHYRDALVEAKAQGEELLAPVDWDDANVVESVGDYTKKAMESFITSPLGIESVLSVLLIIVGIGFFGFAAGKWYFMFDPYPSYRKSGLAQKKAHENYQYLVKTNRDEMNKEINDANNRVVDELTQVMNMRVTHNDLSGRAQGLQISFGKWVVVQTEAQKHLVAVYRGNNRKARSEPAPSYFNDETAIDPTLTDPPNFDLPKLQGVDQVIESVKEAENKIQAITDEIWQRFNPLTNMQPESDGAQSS